MNIELIWILAGIYLTSICCSATTQGKSEGFVDPSPNMLLNYYSVLSKKYTDEWYAKIEEIRTPEDWQLTREKLLSAHLSGIGTFPKHTPLNAHVVGSIERPESIIEKIVFESRPGYYVTSNLYLPLKTSSKPFPVILIITGHNEGKDAYCKFALSLAQNGVAAFVMDTIGQGERVIFMDAKDKPIYEHTTEHSIMTFPCWLTGTSSIQYFLWDAIRAIDYLESRPEIDKNRIGITGASGGGMLTSFLIPIEPRITLAAPTCYLNESALWVSTGIADDGEQSIYGAISGGANHAALIEMAAPCAYQVQAATKDFFPIAGTRQSVSEARKIYSLLGVPDRLRMEEYNGNHSYSLKLMSYFCEWVNKWFLNNKSEILETTAKPNTAKELQCTPTGQVKSSYKDAKWVADFNSVRVNVIAPNRAVPSSKTGLEKYKKSVREAMKNVLSITVPKKLPTICKSIQTSLKVVREEQWLQTEPGITVPCIITKPSQSLRFPAVLLISDNGANTSEIEVLQKAITSKGYLAMNVDVRGIGASSPEPLKYPNINPSQFYVSAKINIQSQNALKCGTTIFQGRLLDAIQCLNFLCGRQDVDTEKIVVIGWGECGVLALTMAAIDNRVAACADIGGFDTYRSLTSVDIPQYPASAYLWNVLAYYDLPEAAACISPRPLLLTGLLGPTKISLQQESLEQSYKATEAAYKIDGVQQAFQLSAEKIEIIGWLRKAVIEGK